MTAETSTPDGKARRRSSRKRERPHMGREFRYHLLSIGVNREANGASVRSAERDAFGMSWTFAQLGYWRADRNRCVTGAQATPSANDAHLEYGTSLADLDLLLLFLSGHLHSTDSLIGPLAA